MLLACAVSTRVVSCFLRTSSAFSNICIGDRLILNPWPASYFLPSSLDATLFATVNFSIRIIVVGWSGGHA